MERAFAKKTDIIIVAFILILAFVGWYWIYLRQKEQPKKPEVNATIFIKNNPIIILPLKEGEERDIEIPGKESVLLHLSNDGSIFFKKSNCPDQVCVKQGKLKISGQSAACLPNEVFIKVESAEEDDTEDFAIGGRN